MDSLLVFYSYHPYFFSSLSVFLFSLFSFFFIVVIVLLLFRPLPPPPSVHYAHLWPFYTAPHHYFVLAMISFTLVYLIITSGLVG